MDLIAHAVTACAISSHDAWQTAIAAKVWDDTAQSPVTQGAADVMPAGVRPCRTDKEREAYVAGAVAKAARDHESIKPALASVLKRKLSQA